jgi:hypothetical protein
LRVSVIAYIYVFGTGLLGIFLFQFFLEDPLFPRGWIIAMELYPGFSLYRGLYELSQSAFAGDYRGIDGMKWRDFGNIHCSSSYKALPRRNNTSLTTKYPKLL